MNDAKSHKRRRNEEKDKEKTLKRAKGNEKEKKLNDFGKLLVNSFQ